MSKFSFIRHAYKDLRAHGVIIEKINSSYILDNNGNSYGGGFSDNPLKLQLTIAVEPQDFLRILVHEYSHFIQWKTQSPYWHNKYRGMNPWIVFERWLGGREYKPQTIKGCIDLIRQCELDCDRIAITLIKEYDIPLKIQSYCQLGSTYQYFYHYVRITRQWEYKVFPLSIPAITKTMPKNLSSDYTRLPSRVKQLFNELLIPVDVQDVAKNKHP